MAATLDVSAAVSYAVAALNLIDKVRMFSAAEKWGKAAEAARALGAPDCLVVAYAQVHPRVVSRGSPVRLVTELLAVAHR